MVASDVSCIPTFTANSFLVMSQVKGFKGSSPFLIWLALPVGNEGMKLYMVMMGMKISSFPTKGQPVIRTPTLSKNYIDNSQSSMLEMVFSPLLGEQKKPGTILPVLLTSNF